MTREACSFCGTVVSTTADPNGYEGWFVSLEDAERMEVEIQADDAYHLQGLIRRLCKARLVLCDACRVSPDRWVLGWASAVQRVDECLAYLSQDPDRLADCCCGEVKKRLEWIRDEVLVVHKPK